MGLPTTPILRKALRSYQVFGANTGVGKTIWSTVLCNAAQRIFPGEKVTYLKPVSTGPEDEKDDRHMDRFTSGIHTRTLFQYGIPVSPHIAASVSPQGIASDQQVLAECTKFVTNDVSKDKGWLFVETAGGVNSPAPSGTTQADLYMPLRAPVVLVGDSKLGGISLSISAFESLRLRGYDVESIVLFKDDQWGNSSYLADYFRKQANIPIAVIDEPPPRLGEPSDDAEAMKEYYHSVNSTDPVIELLHHLKDRHEERITKLENMANEADRHLWYPFTQHTLINPGNIRVIESARGDFFNAVSKDPSLSSDAVLQPTFDGSASWWTQGLGHANPALTLAASYAAGRYGHVLYPGMVHEPAIQLAKTLLEGLQNPRFSRVFYSDNGSTGTEIAIKMALRAARLRYGWTADDRMEIMGLKGAYHGDTMGAMDCSEPGTYNKKVEWYQGKGFWFDVPSVLCSQGKWTVTQPSATQKDPMEPTPFSSLGDVFDLESRIARNEHKGYEASIKSALKKLQMQGRKFGALMLEPVVLGAGGMVLVDPLFQRTLVDTVRQNPHLFCSSGTTMTSQSGENGWSGLPVVFDEVFTGLFRLGRFSSATFLGVHPDISVHAKLLTGGLVPLCVTMASEEIFKCFLSHDKSDALLHGHSYTAHAVGCQVALESLNQLQQLDSGGSWNWAKSAHQPAIGAGIAKAVKKLAGQSSAPHIWSMWSPEFVNALSNQPEFVSGIWAMGSVLAIHLRDEQGAGYTSTASKSLQDALLGDGSLDALDSFKVHTRILGNVLYVMAGQTTEQASVQEIERKIREALSVPS